MNLPTFAKKKKETRRLVQFQESCSVSKSVTTVVEITVSIIYEQQFH